MASDACLDCGTVMTGSDCSTCDGAGRKEAIAMVLILCAVALVMTVYVGLTLL